MNFFVTTAYLHDLVQCAARNFQEKGLHVGCVRTPDGRHNFFARDIWEAKDLRGQFRDGCIAFCDRTIGETAIRRDVGTTL